MNGTENDESGKLVKTLYMHLNEFLIIKDGLLVHGDENPAGTGEGGGRGRQRRQHGCRCGKRRPAGALRFDFPYVRHRLGGAGILRRHRLCPEPAPRYVL